MEKIELLPLTEIDNIYYLESLSFEQLPKGGVDEISDAYLKMANRSRKTIKKHFKEELSVFLLSDNTDNPTRFQSHDLTVSALQASETTTSLTLNGYAYSDQQRYHLEFEFGSSETPSCQKTVYEKGLLAQKTQENFQILSQNLSTLDLRDLIVEEDEKLEHYLSIIFMHYPKDNEAFEAGDRTVYVLKIKPQSIKISYEKETERVIRLEKEALGVEVPSVQPDILTNKNVYRKI